MRLTKKGRQVTSLISILSLTVIILINLSVLDFSDSGTDSISIVGTAGGSSTITYQGSTVTSYSGEDNFGFEATVYDNGLAEFIVNPDSSVSANWEWHFGDGAVNFGEETRYQYIDPGQYTVTLIRLINDEEVGSVSLDMPVSLELSDNNIPDKTVSSEPYNIIDRAGSTIGEGSATIFSPTQINSDEYASIRLQISVADLLENQHDTASDTSRAEEASIQTDDSQEGATGSSVVQERQEVALLVSEVLNIEIGGEDAARFEIESDPYGATKEINEDGFAWWTWTLRPREEAYGYKNSLTVYISRPRETQDGEAMNEPVDEMDIALLVARPSPLTNQRVVLVFAGVFTLAMLRLSVDWVYRRTNPAQRARLWRNLKQENNTPSKKPRNIFIIYAQDDKEKIRYLIQYLEERNYQVKKYPVGRDRPPIKEYTIIYMTDAMLQDDNYLIYKRYAGPNRFIAYYVEERISDWAFDSLKLSNHKIRYTNIQELFEALTQYRNRGH